MGVRQRRAGFVVRNPRATMAIGYRLQSEKLMTRLILFRRYVPTFVLICFLGSTARAQDAPDELRIRVKTTKELVTGGMRDYFMQSEDPVEFRQYIEYLEEPIPQSDLDFLEWKLRDTESDAIAKQCAVLLYRYRRAMGDVHLANLLLEKGDIDAAAVFAINQDANYLDEILRALISPVEGKERLSQSDLPYKYPLLFPLSDWKDERVTEALLALQRRFSINAFIAVALAKHDAEQAAPTVRETYPKAQEEKSPADVLFSASLFRLTGERRFLMDLDDRVRAIADSEEMSETKKFAFVAEALAVLDPVDGRPLLEELLAQIVSVQAPDKFESLLRKVMLYLADMAVTTEHLLPIATALAVLPVDTGLLLNVGLRLNEHLLNSPQGESLLSSPSVQRVRQLRVLRPIPVDDLPLTSRWQESRYGFSPLLR